MTKEQETITNTNKNTTFSGKASPELEDKRHWLDDMDLFLNKAWKEGTNSISGGFSEISKGVKGLVATLSDEELLGLIPRLTEYVRTDPYSGWVLGSAKYLKELEKYARLRGLVQERPRRD
jgi:hypothetical protein